MRWQKKSLSWAFLCARLLWENVVYVFWISLLLHSLCVCIVLGSRSWRNNRLKRTKTWSFAGDAQTDISLAICFCLLRHNLLGFDGKYIHMRCSNFFPKVLSSIFLFIDAARLYSTELRSVKREPPHHGCRATLSSYVHILLCPQTTKCTSIGQSGDTCNAKCKVETGCFK